MTGTLSKTVETKKRKGSPKTWLMYLMTQPLLMALCLYLMAVTRSFLMHGDDPLCHNDHTDHASVLSDWKIKNHASTSSPDPETPFWWLEEKEESDWFERTYVSDERMYYGVRKLPKKVKKYFQPVCGHYRFNETGLPDVSVIVTTQNELSGWTTTTVHSILARTPPHLLKEVIVVDDNGMSLEERGKDVNETEFEELRMLPKVKVIQNQVREGCARSRLVGAKAAKGEVLMFADSHIEMLHSTWYQHLLIPIVENPRTVSMQSLEIIDDNGSRGYFKQSSGNGLGDFNREFSFVWQDHHEISGKEPNEHEPFESAVGPGSLFAIRRDEFWRLGGYDEGLYIWGGENMELSLKAWMCGGRLVFSPCSRVGHMFRDSEELRAKQWPPTVPFRIANKLNLGLNRSVPGMGHVWPLLDDFEKVSNRNDMRVMNIWMGDHPAKYTYYKEMLGSEKLGPEWQQYVDELKTDPAALKQIRKRKENKCHDFDWWDRHVYMRLAGKHHPWSIPLKKYRRKKGRGVSCGDRRASSCEECPAGNGEDWCNGDCRWCGPAQECMDIDEHHYQCSASDDSED